MWVLKKTTKLVLKNIYLRIKDVLIFKESAVNKSLGLILSALK